MLEELISSESRSGEPTKNVSGDSGFAFSPSAVPDMIKFQTITMLMKFKLQKNLNVM